MRKRYIHPMAFYIVIEEESIMQSISNVKNYDGSGNNGSGNSSEGNVIGIDNTGNDDAAAKGFYISWNDDVDF